MPSFRGIKLEDVPILLIFGYGAFFLATFILQAVGLFKPEQNLGLGFGIIAASLGMVFVYVAVVKKELSLGFKDFFTVFLLAGIVIAILVLVPDLAPPAAFKQSIAQMSAFALG